MDRAVLLRIVALGFTLAAAGCQSGDNAGSVLDVGLGNRNAEAEQRQIVDQDDLEAYCPAVRLPTEWAIVDRYEGKKDEEDAAKLVYRASIDDVTRTCARAGGMMTITVALAGRIVPGPVGAAGGAVTLPIKIEVIDVSGQTLYSQIHQHTVQTAAGVGATQFVFTDPAVIIPQPATRTVRVSAGYDVPVPKVEPL